MLKRIWALLLLAALLAGAMAEGVSTEYLVNMAPEDVLLIETRLHELGYLSAEANQTYDTDTRQALESFQQANGLNITGQPDEATLTRLYEGSAISRQDYLRRFIQTYRDVIPLQNGDINSQVQALQRRLADFGYFSGTGDGVFGDATRRAVERFQMVNGLTVTGVADGTTLMRLMADVPISWQGFLSEMSCAAGDVGLNVYVMQNKLKAMGYYEGECSGSFGELTRSAVSAFQRENGLEVTGVADAALWAIVYSGTAVALKRTDVLQIGDSGDVVTQLQTRLNALGYLNREATGRFDYVTETALRLFQMAHELSVTGWAGQETLTALYADTALPVNTPAVLERYAALLSARSGQAMGDIAGVASRMVGSAFSAPDDALYPGFALAQYVCVAAGLPITQPETLIRMADTPVTSGDEVAAGNIVAFQTSDSDSVAMLLTIGAGEGRVIYATADVGYVVMGYISQIDSVSAYRWTGSAS